MSAPIAWDHWSERWRRFLCRLLDHRWHTDTRADPVIPAFVLCRRCGNFYRMTDPRPIVWWRRLGRWLQRGLR